MIDRELYEETLLDHNRHPYHYLRVPQGTNHTAYGFNPTCGDEFTLHLRVEEGVIRESGFEGVGCALSVASASMMAKALEGLTLEEAEALFRRMTAFLHGGEPLPPEQPGLGSLALLGGVFDYPDRIKCANLAWHILHAALQQEQHTVCTE
ncbi:MAG: SUF system NifU family Fe-S cluster assembly protein [Magnetococcales bacterium]|nr:SUF system NifU family Fe-S cluster assembly protein [Magnetococcales bacterium]